LKPVVKIQKIIIRLIAGIRKYEPTTPHCKKLKILKVDDLYNYQLATFMHKHSQGNLPTIFSNYFQRAEEIHPKETRSAKKFRPPLVKTDCGTRFIKKTGAKFWEDLKKYKQIDPNIGPFKKMIYDDIISRYE